MIRLGILTCTEYKKFDLASQTATTSAEQAGLRRRDLSVLRQVEPDITTLPRSGWLHQPAGGRDAWVSERAWCVFMNSVVQSISLASRVDAQE